MFKKSGWRAAAVAACWERDCDGPWLLVSDRDDGPRLFRRYAKRTWTEELFRDEKSSGFHWGESHVTDPTHAARLVLRDRLGDVPGVGPGVAGDPGGAAAVPGVDPPADAEPVSDRLAVVDVLRDP